MPDGTTLHGIATYEERVHGFRFVDNAGAEPFYACRGALTLGADVAIFAEKEAEEGALWQQVAAPPYAAMDHFALALDLAARKAARLARKGGKR
jgi:hypothetical protein